MRSCLAGNPAPSMDQIKAETGLTERRIWKTAAWKAHEERLLDDYLKQNPRATASDAAAAFDCSPTKIVGTDAWRDHQHRRGATGARRRAKEQPLTRATLACRPDDAADHPAKQTEARDQLFRQVLEAADPDTRASLNSLRGAAQQSLLEHLLGVFGPGEAEALSSAGALEILAEAAKSWLEEREQERRRQSRESRGRHN